MTVRILLAVVLAGLATWPARTQPPAAPAKAPPEPLDGPPVVSAKAWLVADGKTGRKLWGANEAQPLAIASTSKIMTAWVVLKLAAADPKVLDEVTTFSERAAKTGGTSCRLAAGEQVSIRNLLYGLLLPSGNDAAVALAEHFGPRLRPKDAPDGDAVGSFVAEMNRQAAALQMTETKYLDPHGLGLNKSSARNLAVLAATALKDDTFRRYVGTRTHSCEVTGPNGTPRAVTWENTNRLLGIEGYQGVKTGTTTAAGACLVASGVRGGDHLIVVVLGSTSADGRYVDSRNLFRWAWREREGAGQARE